MAYIFIFQIIIEKGYLEYETPVAITRAVLRKVIILLQSLDRLEENSEVLVPIEGHIPLYWRALLLLVMILLAVSPSFFVYFPRYSVLIIYLFYILLGSPKTLQSHPTTMSTAYKALPICLMFPVEYGMRWISCKQIKYNKNYHNRIIVNNNYCRL